MRTSERLNGGVPSPGRAHALLAGAEARVSLVWQRLSWLHTPEPEPQAYVPGETPLARALFWPGLVGAVGSLLVLWGASQPTSPFTLNRATLSTLGNPAFSWYEGSPWYFGTGAPIGNVVVGVVAVYAGMFLMIRAWVALARLTRLYPGTRVRQYVPVFVAWVLPLLVVAPLFSHDAFSYVAQGEEMTRGINPYLYPPSILGPQGNPYAGFVDHWWWLSTSPYGPVFLGLAGLILSVVHHNELAALVGFRLLSVLGVVLLGVFTPRLARSYGYDGAQAFVLVVLNPLVLLHLVAGEHNDAIMMGLLVAGLAFARERHPLIGIVLCSVAGAIKVPALIGVVYIGWDWAGVGVAWRARVRPLAKALAASGACLLAITYAIGIGWGWVGSLLNTSSVRSWMDPATGLGELFARLVSGLGLGGHATGIIDVARGIGLAAAAGVAVWLLLRADGGVGSLRAIGLTMLAVVVLGPEIQPWYLVWGVILLLPIARGRARAALMLLSAVMSYLGLPGGRMLLSHLEKAGPLVVLAAVAALLGVGVASLAPRMLQVAQLRRAAGRRVGHVATGGNP